MQPEVTNEVDSLKEKIVMMENEVEENRNKLEQRLHQASVSQLCVHRDACAGEAHQGYETVP